MLKVTLFITTVVFSMAASAAKSTNKETLHLDDVLKTGNYTASISSSMGSAEIDGKNVDIYSLKPMLTAKFKKFEGIVTVPFSWHRHSKSNDDNNLNLIGRPEIITQKVAKKVKNTSIVLAGSIKLPMSSSKDADTIELNRAWQFSPMFKTRTIASKKVDVTFDAALEYNTESSKNELTLTRPLTARVDVAFEYKYDKKITVGTGARGSSALGKYNLKLNKTTIDTAARDRLSVGVFGHYAVDKSSRVVASFYSALKNEDTLSGLVGLVDNPQESSKIAASVGIEKSF